MISLFKDSTNIDNRCDDSIMISNSVRNTREVATVLDYRFNGVITIIETSESVLVVTLKSCLPTSISNVVGRGFRAVVKKNCKCYTI